MNLKIKNYSNFIARSLAVFTSFFLILFSSSAIAQNSCSGSITITEGNCITIGNGTAGFVQVTFNNINIFTQNGGNYDLAYVTASDGGYINTGTTGSFIQTADNCTGCSGVSTLLNDPDYIGDGYVTVCVSNGGAGVSSVDISWTTVNGSGTDVCVPTCSDGIQNQGETGIDCGGPFCVPCSCSDGIQNFGETGIDCGGLCAPCGTCFDGIQNGSETGVDCGGSCAIVCGTNGASPDGTSSSCCSTAAPVSVYPTVCDQIGSDAYNLNSPEVNIASTNVTAGCLPPGTSTGCGAYGSVGTWTHYSLEAGVNYLQLAPQTVTSFGTGNSTTYHAYFQGPSCAALNYVACQPAIDFSSGGYYFYESSVTGLDPNQDVWVYTWNSSNKAFNYTVQAVGAAPATNTACPGSTALGDACNLGAQGATFNTPGSQGVICSGGAWGSNENTTFYSFTATATTGTLNIQDIICNDGTTGSAQFAVWTSCGAIGTYGAGFLGCAVGTGAITLSSLVAGQTYYIAADGFAGDNCTWSFSGSGILLPIELGALDAIHTGTEVFVDWTTLSEKDNDYFVVERTLDGREFEDLGIVYGNGTTTEENDYSFVDYSPYQGTSYYRIKQFDFDGKVHHSELVSVNSGGATLTIVKTINLAGQEVPTNTKGMVIDLMSDGTTRKRVNN